MRPHHIFKPAFILALTAGLLLPCIPARAGEAVELFPKQLALDGHTFDSTSLVEAFREIAFSSYIAPNAFPDQISAPPGPYAYPRSNFWGKISLYKDRYPWLYEYLYRDQGIPRFFAINKWTGPVRISLGYPNDLQPIYSGRWTQSKTDQDRKQRLNSPCVGPVGNPPFCVQDDDLIANPFEVDGDGDKLPAARSVVEDEIKATIPILQELTGLPISYIPHDQETSENFGNVRIMLRRFQPQKAVVPSGIDMTPNPQYMVLGTRQGIGFQAIKQSLTTAVDFTPYADQQVAGYLLPNADNSIGMSLCSIKYNLSEPLLRALVRECLVRSLGLPNAPAVGPSMILGLWNQHVGVAKLRLEPDKLRGGTGEKLWKDSEPMRLWGPDAPLKTPPITDFDRLMIKTLYNPAIKPGMSFTDFYKLAQTLQ